MASYVANQTASNPSYEGIGFRVATGANPPSGGLRNGDTIRYYPRAGYNSRMVGGVFEGSTDGSSYSVLHTITETPPNGWTEVSADFETARYFRYRAPDGAHGNVAEIEFYRSGAKLIAAASGTPGSWSGGGNDTFRSALDGDTSTFFDAPQPNGAYVELDSGRGTFLDTPPGYDNLTVTNATGTGSYPAGQRVPISVLTVPDGQQFGGWEGFANILDDPTSPDTTATIPGLGVSMWLTATFKALPPGSHILQVINGSGDGTYPTGTMVTVRADPPPAAHQFAGWTGDIAILSNPFLATTTALVPAMNVSIAASYSAANSNDMIRFYPRSSHTTRMVGEIFEGTNGDPINGPYTTIYTISYDPPQAWNQIHLDLKDYRYLRYRGPENSFGNVAEIEFHRDGAKVIGVAFGTPGSWSDQGNTFHRAFDGNLDTFFDAPIPTGAYAGIDTQGVLPPGNHTLEVIGGSGTGVYPAGTAVTVRANPLPEGLEFAGWTGDISILADPSQATTTATIPSANARITANSRTANDLVVFSPRPEHTNRMLGGVFEGTNGDPINGPYETVYTVRSEPPALGSSVATADLKDYRYLRYRGPENSFGNVAEIAFYRDGVKLTGSAFGTAGSWSNQGNTFHKALDGNLETFFDAPIPTGAYVGIDTKGIPPPGSYILEVVGGTGSGTYPAGTVVTVSATLSDGATFVSWTGDTAILADPSLPTTAATIPSFNARIATTNRFLSDAVRFTPRPGHANRMVGGVFEGTNGHPIDGPYETIYTVTQPPEEGGVSIAEVDLKNYRYLRYRGPENSFGNVAEIGFPVMGRA